MKSDAPARPTPFGTNQRGNIHLYDGESLAQYRLLNGVTTSQVADHLRCAQSLVTHYETGRGSVGGVQARQAIRMLDAVDAVVRNREALVAEGRDRAAGIFKPRVERARGRWRTRTEAAAILQAQGRGGER